MKEQWPPQYSLVLEERQRRFNEINGNPDLIMGANEYYSTRYREFINDWCITYDPRNSVKETPTMMPFIVFKRQEEFLEFLMCCIRSGEDGLAEKSRDMGATWLCCALSVWLWIFVSGSTVGWGSRKAMYVDELGVPNSIFEKMRMTIDYLPRFFWPKGFDRKRDISLMKIKSPETGNTITGEAGDNIGRGGRSTVYFKDESALYEHPESIEAALGDNTSCQIDISTVHGTNTVFHRKREAGEVWENVKQKIKTGITRVFILDWRDHPLKTQKWYDRRKEKAERDGLIALFAQEVDRDPSAAVEGVLIPNQWVKAAIDAHKNKLLKGLNWHEGLRYGALDVADGGRDKNSLGIRKGSIVTHMSEWAFSPDPGVSANMAVNTCRLKKVNELHYDCIGIGAAVKSETNRLIREGILKKGLSIIPWNAAKGPLFPKGHVVSGDKSTPLNSDFFSNLKAQGWWRLRSRFEKTWKAITQGIQYPVEELISLPSTLPKLHQLVKEISQPTYGPNGVGKIVIDKMPDGAKSPNLADSLMMMLWPVKRQKVLI